MEKEEARGSIAGETKKTTKKKRVRSPIGTPKSHEGATLPGSASNEASAVLLGLGQWRGSQFQGEGYREGGDG